MCAFLDVSAFYICACVAVLILNVGINVCILCVSMFCVSICIRVYGCVSKNMCLGER